MSKAEFVDDHYDLILTIYDFAQTAQMRIIEYNYKNLGVTQLLVLMAGIVISDYFKLSFWMSILLLAPLLWAVTYRITVAVPEGPKDRGRENLGTDGLQTGANKLGNRTNKPGADGTFPDLLLIFDNAGNRFWKRGS